MSQAPAFDTVRRIATPEGCELELRIAGPIVRARAWLLDSFIRLVAWFGLAMLGFFFRSFGFGLFLVCAFLLEWFYPVFFEVYRNGQTPGKRICGLRVLHDDGRPVGWSASFIRNTVRFVDFMPLLYAFGFVATLFSADGKRLGDLAAGTVVVHADDWREKPVKNKEPEEAGAEPPLVPLTLEEQQAVIEYRRRAAQLTEERALELAGIPLPLIGGLTPEQARRRLLRIGNFLLGKR